MRGVLAVESGLGMWRDPSPFPLTPQGSLSPVCPISKAMLCKKFYLLRHCPGIST